MILFICPTRLDTQKVLSKSHFSDIKEIWEILDDATPPKRELQDFLASRRGASAESSPLEQAALKSRELPNLCWLWMKKEYR